jgi:ferredoxin
MSGRQQDRALKPVPWPAIAGFFRGYLHQDAGLEHASIEDAFDQFWGDGSAEERARFAHEWRAISRRLNGRVWRRVRPILAALGANWVPQDGKAFARLRTHIDRNMEAEDSPEPLACKITDMSKLTVEGYGTFEVPAGKRLVNAIEHEASVDILHACGGNARCTTCRVEFVEGEPQTMTVAEKERLAARGLTAVRLSCQILCDHDMTVRAISRLEGSGRPDPGPRPMDEITPPPVWT